MGWDVRSREKRGPRGKKCQGMPPHQRDAKANQENGGRGTIGQKKEKTGKRKRGTSRENEQAKQGPFGEKIFVPNQRGVKKKRGKKKKHPDDKPEKNEAGQKRKRNSLKKNGGRHKALEKNSMQWKIQGERRREVRGGEKVRNHRKKDPTKTSGMKKPKLKEGPGNRSNEDFSKS